MKMFKKKTILILIVSIVMIFGSVGIAYAGGGDDDPPTPTAGSWASNTGRDTEKTIGASYVSTPNNVYILAVSTGVSSGDVSHIVFRYLTKDGALITQLLEPDDQSYTESSYGLFYSTESVSRSGSRLASYNSLFYDSSSASDDWITRLVGKDGKHYINYTGIASRYAKIFAAETGDTLSYYLKCISTSTFDSYSTEYLRFTTEYEVSRVIEIGFVLSGQGTGNWSLNGFRLYSVNEAEAVSDDTNYTKASKAFNSFLASTSSDYPEFYISSGRWGSAYYKVTNLPKITTYSMLSNKAAMIFSGTLIMESDDAQCKSQLGYTDGIGYFRFLNNDYIKTVDPKSISSTYTYSLPDANKNSATGIIAFNMYEKNTAYTSNSVTYNFKVNIADIYGAGIDMFLSANNDGYLFRDCLTAVIHYTNTMGYEETVRVPVIANALLELAAITDERDVNGGDVFEKLVKQEYTNFAQQGTSILFSVEFPNIKSLDSIDLSYSNDKDLEDLLIIKNIEVYDDYSYGVRADYYSHGENSLDATLSDTNCTAVYKTVEESNNIYLSGTIAERDGIKFDKASNVPDVTDDYTDTYLVTLTTSDVQTAGTTNDIYVQFTYVTTDGTEGVTDEYEVSEACQDYYGYLPAVTTSEIKADWYSTFTKNRYYTNSSGQNVFEQLTCVDSSYIYGMRQGGSIRFFIQAPNLSRISGMRVRIGKDTEEIDQWQLGSLTIQTVEEVGDVTIADLSQAVTISGVSIYRTSERNVVGEQIYTKDNINLLVKDTGTKTLDLETSQQSGEYESRDYSDYYYKMNFEMASSNLHFDSAAKTYEVRVTVADNEEKGTTDDSTGSDNQYYFQLVFKNGVSGYVLANQQFESDGFRAGKTETFYVSCNEDFGDVTAINIIPDVVTSDSEKTDRLCIESIAVIKKNTNSVNKKYSFTNIGWIKMEYHDDSESVEDKGIPLDELRSVYKCSSSAYMVSLEFAISYGEYGEVTEITYDKDGNATPTTVTGSQFVGEMLADITYVRSNGETADISNVSLVNLMYEYNGETANKKTETVGTEERYVSDSDWMFRGNSTDRFLIDVDDAVEIKSITLKGQPHSQSNLTIKDISVSIVSTSGSNVYINSNNEYQASYTIDPAVLVNKVTSVTLPKKVSFPANKYTSVYFEFEENEITVEDETTTLESQISRLPESCNDTMNLYIYMGEGAVSPTSAGQKLSTSVYYSSNATGKTYMTKITDYDEKYEGDQLVLYNTGISATNMTNITNLYISAKSAYTGAKVDHVVIQQVRNGTVIDTYYIKLIGKNAANGVTMSVANSKDYFKETQTVDILMSEDTPLTTLTAEDYDIAVSMQYTTELGDETVYQSPFVYLTDSEVTSVKGGQIATFTFSEACVKEIKSITIAGVNGLTGSVESAIVRTFSTDSSDSLVLENYYSFADGITLSSDGEVMNVTNDEAGSRLSLSRVNMTFKNVQSSAEMDSSGNDPIAITLCYETTNGTEETLTISDIRSVATKDSSFAPGGEVTIATFLKGVKSLKYIDIDPTDSDSSTRASWNLSEITYSIVGSTSSGERTIAVNELIKESLTADPAKRINLSGVTVKLTVTGSNGGSIAENSTVKITANSGESIGIKVDLSGSLDGYGYYYKAEANAGTDDMADAYLCTDSKMFYKVPSNTTGSDQTYTLRFFSEEDNTKMSKVVITVPSE